MAERWMLLVNLTDRPDHGPTTNVCIQKDLGFHGLYWASDNDLEETSRAEASESPVPLSTELR